MAANRKKNTPLVKPVTRGKLPELFSFRKWFKNQFSYYCSITAMHGWNLLIRKEISVWERGFWAVICIIAIIVASILLWISLHWTSQTPTVTVIESTHYPTWNIPFPSVTICNLNKIGGKALERRVSMLKLPPNITADIARERLKLLIHYNGEGQAKPESYQQLHEIIVGNNLSVSGLLFELAPKCEDMLEKCMWKGTQLRCDTAFQTTLSLKGICCSFNYQALRRRFVDSEARASASSMIPRRVSACGFLTGLSVILNPFPDDYVASSISTYGYRVLVHDSHTFPGDNAEMKMVQTGIEAFLSVMPEATYSTMEVVSKSIAVRNCYEENEIKLDTLSWYTYTNCILECRRMIILENCGCIPYNYPKNGSERICEMTDIECFIQNKISLSTAAPETNLTLHQLQMRKERGTQESSCACLPDCHFNSYVTEISTGILNRMYSYSSQSFFQGVKLDNQTILHVFYNDLVSTRYRTDMVQNWMSVLAMFGGLTGLFLGFSFVTGYEIVYMFTVRFLIDFLHHRKKQQKLRKDIELPDNKY